MTVLVQATYELFNIDPAAALRVGVAIECIHVYSLVHDDLPCMDDDDMRRGKPTLHRQFDEATAVLVGDSLQTLAFVVLCRDQHNKDHFVRADLVMPRERAAGPDRMVTALR